MVHGFVIPHAVQRVVLGGVPILAAVTTLKDARPGAELAKLDQGAAAPAGHPRRDRGPGLVGGQGARCLFIQRSQLALEEVAGNG